MREVDEILSNLRGCSASGNFIALPRAQAEQPHLTVMPWTIGLATRKRSKGDQGHCQPSRPIGVRDAVNSQAQHHLEVERHLQALKPSLLYREAKHNAGTSTDSPDHRHSNSRSMALFLFGDWSTFQQFLSFSCSIVAFSQGKAVHGLHGRKVPDSLVGSPGVKSQMNSCACGGWQSG